MTTPLFDRLDRELEARRRGNLFRAIPQHRPVVGLGIDLSSNSYLALHADPDINAEARRLKGDALCGNLASRLIRETSPLAGTLEAELAAWKKTEAALLFNSGYAANLGILQAVCSRETVVFCDRLNHASILDGILLSGARLERYHHGDCDDLARRLAASNAPEKLIVTDAVFSMDGDCAPLPAIVELGRAYNCCIMVDEAHAVGVLGARGSGLVEAYGVADAVDICIGTLSKAVAGVGGFFAGSKFLHDYLINHARSFIYSTALPHADYAFDCAAVRHIRANPGLGATLLEKTAAFRDTLHDLGFDTLNSTTQIVPCIIGDNGKALALSEFLAQRNIFAPAVRPPSVPPHTARIRFSVHLGLSTDDEASVFAALQKWKSRND